MHLDGVKVTLWFSRLHSSSSISVHKLKTLLCWASQKIVGHSNPSTLLLVAGTFVAKQVSNRKSIDLIVTSACIH